MTKRGGLFAAVAVGIVFMGAGSALSSSEEMLYFPNDPPPDQGGVDPGFPPAFVVSGPVPNPYCDTAAVDYGVPQGGGTVLIKVYDAASAYKVTLVDSVHNPGTYRTVWNTAGYAEGMYYFRSWFNGALYPTTLNGPKLCAPPPPTYNDPIGPPGPFAVSVGPCPFSTTLNVFYTIPDAGMVTAEIHDISRRVATLRNGTHAAGKYKVVWDPRTVGAPHGVKYRAVVTYGGQTLQSVLCSYL